MEHRAGRVALGAAKIIVTMASVGVVVLGCYGWTVVRQVQTGTATDNVIAPPSASTTPVPKAPGQDMNILLVGLDSRTDAHGNPLPRSVLDALNAGTDDGQLNTDTLIVVHVPGDGGAASAVSIPRDSYVDIAGGFGKHKINSAYAYGMNAEADRLRAQGDTDQAAIGRQSLTAGRRNLVQTVQNFTGVSIDHYAEVNLYGFDQISQALGGVPVCLNKPVHDSYSGADFAAGEQTLSGVRALQFVRQRHGLANGDLDRERRQQAFLASAAHQLLSAGTLTDPGKLSAIITAVQNAVVVDQGWDLFQFAQQVQGIAGANITFDTIPVVDIAYWTPADGVAVQVDPAQVRAFVAGRFDRAKPTSTTPPSSSSSTPATSSKQAPPSSSTAPPPVTASGVTCVD
ncbi:LCP family protein [Kutzneria albida]|uniref:LytR family transcription regulator n=1 Tax=Kutzneria albida DSM 43870 TaxID=1449976 RepID=W5W5Z5_9PSEU|nr:LCP family protein [Kutzneria albida]AHH95926.1 LytR family transcription regulator [Kutzneria albida DSM 43870]